MDNATVIKLLTQQKDDIKDLMEGQSAVISARVDAKFDQKFAPLEAKVDSILEHNRRQNGWIKSHTEKLEEIDGRAGDLESKGLTLEHYQTNCPANKLAAKLSKRRFWVIAVTVTTIVYIVLATVWHTIGFGDLILRLVDLI